MTAWAIQQTQDRIFRAAETRDRAPCAGPRPALWLTYHSYYKAPDLLGPTLSRQWGIPYVADRGNPRVKAPARTLCTDSPKRRKQPATQPI